MWCHLEGIDVYYEEHGEGKPILMLHGWSLNHRSMVDETEPVFSRREGWKRIYLDLPGHGQTPGADWVTNQDRMLQVVLGFVDRVMPGQRFVVAGVSAGAYLARGVVYHRAAWVDGLLLIVPLIVAEDARRTLPAHVVLVQKPGLLAELPPDQAEMFQGLVVVQTRQNLELLRDSVSLAGESGDPEFQARIRQHPENYAFSFDVDALPQPFAGPTLIVAGRQDSLVGYRDAWDIVENYPRASFVVLDRAGHLLGIEQRALLRALIDEWLDRVEEYAG